MATITSYGYPTGDNPQDADLGNLQSESSLSSTQVVYTNADGTKIVFNGTGFSLDNGNLSWTSLSSMEWTSSNLGTVYETINNFAASIAGPNGGEPVNGSSLYALLTSQSNTANGSSGNDLIDVGEGTSTIYLGSGTEDILTGRNNSDTFVFGPGDWNANHTIGAGPNNTFIFQNAGAINLTVGAFDIYNGVAASVQFATGSTTLTINPSLANNFDVTGGGSDTVIFAGNSEIGDFRNYTFTNWNSTDKIIIECLPGPATYYGTHYNNTFEDFGNQTINGGGATDTAVFTEAHTQYQITENSSTSLTITDEQPGHPDYSTTFNNITYFQFTDGTYSFNDLAFPSSVTGKNFSVAENNSVAISSFITVANPKDHYVFEDFGGGTGHFTVNGTAEPDGQVISVTTANLASVDYVGGSSAGSDFIEAGIYDSSTNTYYWSSPFTATTAAPSYPENPGNNDEWILSNGQWAASAEPGSIPSGYQVAGTGEFTGSATSDILWYNGSTGDTQEWLLNYGGWAGSVDLGTHPVNGTDGASYQIVGTDNSTAFAGNGIDDVLWTSTNSNGTVAVDIWELNSSGQWMASVSPGSHPAGYSVAGTGDWTGNGTDGILWYNASTGDTDEWQLNNGQWSASVDLGSHPGSSWTIAGVGDFFGNGRDDVLWTNASGGTVQTDIWELGSNGQWINSVSPGSHPAGYQVVAVGDFTGNGTSDILWYNASTGDTDEWLIKNGQWAGSVDLGTHPGNYQIAGAGSFTGNGTSDILWHSPS